MTGQQLKMWSQETVQRNRINLAASEKVTNSHKMIAYSDLLFIYLFISLFICLLILFIYLFLVVDTSETTKACQSYICICLRHKTVLLFCMPCDWEIVKNVVPGNSSTKPDQTGGHGKGMKQSKMFNYSVYSRLGNK